MISGSLSFKAVIIKQEAHYTEVNTGFSGLDSWGQVPPWPGIPASPGSMRCSSRSRLCLLKLSMAEVSSQRISKCLGWKDLPSWAVGAFCRVGFGEPLHSDQTCGREAAMSSKSPHAVRAHLLRGVYGRDPGVAQTWRCLGPGAVGGTGG